MIITWVHVQINNMGTYKITKNMGTYLYKTSIDRNMGTCYNKE